MQLVHLDLLDHLDLLVDQESEVVLAQLELQGHGDLLAHLAHLVHEDQLELVDH